MYENIIFISKEQLSPFLTLKQQNSRIFSLNFHWIKSADLWGKNSLVWIWLAYIFLRKSPFLLPTIFRRWKEIKIQANSKHLKAPDVPYHVCGASIHIHDYEITQSFNYASRRFWNYLIIKQWKMKLCKYRNNAVI